jgi:hypothetical protein
VVSFVGACHWIDALSHDKTVFLSPGYSFFTGYFGVPSSVSVGTYIAWFAIKDGSMNGPDFNSFQRNDLTVTPPTFTIDSVVARINGSTLSVTVDEAVINYRLPMPPDGKKK